MKQYLYITPVQTYKVVFMRTTLLLPAAAWSKYCHESDFVKGLEHLYKVLLSQQDTRNICHHCWTWGQSPKTSSMHTLGRKCSFRNLHCTFSDVPSVNKCPRALIPAESNFVRDIGWGCLLEPPLPTGIDESWAQPKPLQLLWLCMQEGWLRLVRGL